MARDRGRIRAALRAAFGGAQIRVGYDITPVRFDRTGERRYAVELLAALAARPEVDIVPLELTARTPVRIHQRVAQQALAEALWYPLGVPRTARREALSLVHYPRHVFTRAVGLAVPAVVTIHDVFPLRHPELYSGVIAHHHRLVTRGSARGAERVLTGSEFSRGEIADLTGVPVERIVVTPYGVGPQFRPVDVDDEWLARRFGITRPFVLCIGTLEPRKNLVGALDAFERLRGDAMLVLTGGRGWKDEELQRRLSAFGGALTLTGYLEDDELVKLLSAADCFVHPAMFEGFGFPVVEAMACGAPVVSSDGGSLPEVVGDAGVLVPATEPDALADAIGRVLADDALRADLRARGRARAAASFSWERCADATLGVYGEILGNTGESLA